MVKGRLAARLGLDPLARAQALVEQGDKAKAAAILLKAKQPLEAARLFFEAGRTLDSIAAYARVVFPEGFEEYAAAKPHQMAGLLARIGQLNDAVQLYELARDHKKAAECAIRLRDWGRAARNYERDQDWATAAIYYEKTKRWADAARALGRESTRIRRQREGGADQALRDAHRELDLRRAGLLEKAGDHDAVAKILRAWPPRTFHEAQLVERVGEVGEVVDGYLRIDRADEALRVLRQQKQPNPELLARVLSLAGHHQEAARLHSARGASEAAAAALEVAGDRLGAARRWEQEGEFEKAAENYAAAERPRDQARCLAAARRFEDAAAAYSVAGDHREASNCLLQARRPYKAAVALLQLDDETDAVEMLKQVPVNDPDYPSAVFELAPRLLRRGGAQDALRRINLVPDAVRGAGDWAPEWLYWEARALEELGREVDALPRYERLLTLRSEHRDAAARRLTLQIRAPQTGFVPTVASAMIGEAHQEAVPTSELPTDPAAGAAPAAPRLAMDGLLPAGHLMADRYQIIEAVGRGGMGQVYRARDLVLQEEIAIKTVVGGGQSEDEERLFREVQICRRITHPNVVRVHDIGRVAGGWFVTMELLGGTPLDRLLQDRSPLPLAQVRAILMQTLAGLDAAHRLGVVHRDLKPANLMLEDDSIKILDFGIARMRGNDSTITQTGMAVGSPAYMSPEQLQVAEVDGRSDLYAVGVLAFRLLTGREPFEADNVPALAYAQINTAPPSLEERRPNLDERWRTVVMKLLAKQPADRFASARDTFTQIKQLPIR